MDCTISLTINPASIIKQIATEKSRISLVIKYLTACNASATTVVISIKNAGSNVNFMVFFLANSQQLKTNKASAATSWFEAPNAGQILFHLPLKAKAALAGR